MVSKQTQSLASDGNGNVTELLTARQVARILNIGERTVWSKAYDETDSLPLPIKLGPQIIRWRPSDIEQYVATRSKRVAT